MGKISDAKKEMSAYRVLMREAKTSKEHAEYQRDFRKAKGRYYELMLGFKNSIKGK